MKASGNGEIALCANNLLRLYKGEVPYERVKGLHPKLMDSPALKFDNLAQEAERLISIYEPRAIFKTISIRHGETHGDFIISAEIDERRDLNEQ